MISGRYQKKTRRIAEADREALEYARKWRVTSNVKKSAEVVFNEDKANPVNLQMEVGRSVIYRS